MGWMNLSAAALITEDKLVFSHVNSETPWNPFTVSSYDLWGDSWSFPKEEQMPGKAKQGCQPQSLVAVKDEVFTVQAEGKEGRAVLYGVSRLDSDRPLYSSRTRPSSATTLRATAGTTWLWPGMWWAAPGCLSLTAGLCRMVTDMCRE